MRIRPIQLWFVVMAACACGNKASEPAPSAQPAATPAVPSPAAAAPATPAPAAPLAALPAVPAGAKVSFVEPKDGEKVEGPLENGKVFVPVKMAAEGIAVKPAGPVDAGSGHFHILIDTDPVPAGTIVPKDEQHLHFGKGQSEARLELTPGSHTLQLQLADGIHRSYGPQLATSIKIDVVAAGSMGSQAAAEHEHMHEHEHAPGHEHMHAREGHTPPAGQKTP